ncbi:Nucleoside 5-triphosphatase RdgB (dHAPTP, dITP, XTP-specific) [Brevinematales bacterium NS]|nr:RdgB/HAM1 family non-canonical purine NTP pyrophosphatase [Brevinematales bacterium]QJR21564.1 Nucleoside 5-triphosphatase RdgB (dHAPTP, dITP, XTP-specific) [Brevinematales bacterium NS]
MREALLCTKNPHKVVEIQQILPMFRWVTLEEVGFSLEIPEEGNTFEENATQKVIFVKKHLSSSLLAVSDDSGLEVDALNGRPGVHSARYLGNDRDYTRKCLGLLSELGDTPFEKRTARFVCVVAVFLSSGDIFTFRGTCEGRIGYEMRGSGGFGFDPIFLPEDYHYEKSLAELSPEEKNAISHRGRAFRAFHQWVEQEGKRYGLV